MRARNPEGLQGGEGVRKVLEEPREEPVLMGEAALGHFVIAVVGVDVSQGSGPDAEQRLSQAG